MFGNYENDDIVKSRRSNGYVRQSRELAGTNLIINQMSDFSLGAIGRVVTKIAQNVAEI